MMQGSRTAYCFHIHQIHEITLNRIYKHTGARESEGEDMKRFIASLAWSYLFLNLEI